MKTTPAVGVGAGRSGRRGWLPRLPRIRLALLGPIIVAGLLASVAFAATAAVPRPAAGGQPLSSLGLTAEYDVQADINWKGGALTVSSVAHVTNTSRNTVAKLAFNLLPLKLGNLQNLTVAVGKNKVTPTVMDQTVIVTLPSSLAPKQQVNVTIGYRAFFNTKLSGKKVLFMKVDGTAVAYRWIPWLSRVQQFYTPNFGETWVTGNSPRVTVTFTDDAPLYYATSGAQTGTGDNSATFTARNVRDFNFAISPGYKVKVEVWNGIKIRVLYRTDNPDALMTWVIRAMERFTDRVGQYPYDKLDVAETPAGVGMESPGMIWIDGTLAQSRFPYIVVHETAHQWFYSTIGNNQATNPFLDEAMSDFLTRDLLTSFRSSNCAQARLDLTVYKYSASCYPEVVYNQGGLYLRDYRADVGGEAFWQGVRNFYQDFKFRIASTRSLLDALDAASGRDPQLHAERFPGLYD